MASDTGKIRAKGAQGILHIRYYDRTGRQREESTRQTDWTEAARILANREAAVKNGSPITPQIGRFTFEDGEALIVADYELNDRDSLAHLKRRIRIGLAPWFGRRKMATISTPDLTAYATARKKAGAANATIILEFAALRRMFTLAIRDGKLLQRPAFPKLKPAPARRGFFEPAAFASVRAHLPNHHQPWATVDYYTGWRVKSDLWSLEWPAVDRDQCLIRIAAEDTKNDTPRVFSYRAFPDVVQAIDDCWRVHLETEAEGRIEPRVFVRMSGTWKGQPIKSGRKAWITACRLAGQPGRTPHAFRRTAARNFERHGVPRKVAKQLIGHKTDEMYDRYAIVIEQDLHDAADKLADGLAEDARKRATREAADQAGQGNQGQTQGQTAKMASEAGKGKTAKLRRVK